MPNNDACALQIWRTVLLRKIPKSNTHPTFMKYDLWIAAVTTE
jgi:hypothetical protein